MTSYKTTIIVGIIFLIFTRDWFDDLFLRTFPSLKRYNWIIFLLKLLVVMFTFWLADSFVDSGSSSSSSDAKK